jgi:single-stranded-DNA-specific exonuclease
MDRAMVALELMLAESLEEASMLAERLEGLNRDRQKVTRRMMGEAEEQFAQSEAANVVILHSEEWSPSLVGLVAGKYVEKTGKPTIAIGRDGECRYRDESLPRENGGRTE